MNNKDEASNGKKALIKILFGSLLGIALSVMATAFFALFASKGALPYDKPMPYVMICTLAGVFIGSFSTVRRMTGKRWAMGLAVGACAFMVLFLLGMIFSFSREGVPHMMGITLLAGLLGGLPREKKRKGRR